MRSYWSGVSLAKAREGLGELSGNVDYLPRLRSRNDTVKVRVFDSFAVLFLAFCDALSATLLLLLLLLFAGTFSLAFIHAFLLGEEGPRGYPDLYSVRRFVERSAGPHYIIAKSVDASTGCLPTIAAAARSTPAVSIAVATAEARFARLGLIHLDIAALEFGVVELLDRFTGFVRGGHLYEAESFRLSGEFVRDHGCTLHLTNLREEFVEIVIGDRVGQIAYVQFTGHFALREFMPGGSEQRTRAHSRVVVKGTSEREDYQSTPCGTFKIGSNSILWADS
jgi:hypothetical protein